MRQYTMMAALAALVLGCGDDPAPAPTFEDLVASKWRISYGTQDQDPENFNEDSRYGRQRPLAEMTPIACTLNDQPVRCYSLDGTCTGGSGDFISICFDDRAELVGCIQDATSPGAGFAAVAVDTFPDKLPIVVLVERTEPNKYICEVQSLPRS